MFIENLNVEEINIFNPLVNYHKNKYLDKQKYRYNDIRRIVLYPFPSFLLTIGILGISISIIYCKSIDELFFLCFFLILFSLGKIVLIINTFEYIQSLKIKDKNDLSILIEKLNNKYTKNVILTLSSFKNKSKQYIFPIEDIKVYNEPMILDDNILYFLEITFNYKIKESDNEVLKHEKERLAIQWKKKFVSENIYFDTSPNESIKYRFYYQSNSSKLPFIIKNINWLLFISSIFGIEFIYQYFLKNKYIEKELCFNTIVSINKV